MQVCLRIQTVDLIIGTESFFLCLLSNFSHGSKSPDKHLPASITFSILHTSGIRVGKQIQIMVNLNRRSPSRILFSLLQQECRAATWCRNKTDVWFLIRLSFSYLINHINPSIYTIRNCRRRQRLSQTGNLWIGIGLERLRLEEFKRVVFLFFY